MVLVFSVFLDLMIYLDDKSVTWKNYTFYHLYIRYETVLIKSTNWFSEIGSDFSYSETSEPCSDLLWNRIEKKWRVGSCNVLPLLTINLIHTSIKIHYVKNTSQRCTGKQNKIRTCNQCHFHSNVPAIPEDGAYYSQHIRFARTCRCVFKRFTRSSIAL